MCVRDQLVPTSRRRLIVFAVMTNTLCGLSGGLGGDG